jgi:hypothetical protein
MAPPGFLNHLFGPPGKDWVARCSLPGRLKALGPTHEYARIRVVLAPVWGGRWPGRLQCWTLIATAAANGYSPTLPRLDVRMRQVYGFFT